MSHEVEMTEHLSTDVVERFHQHALRTDDRRLIYDHIVTCEPCRQRVVDSRTETIALQALSNQLLPTATDETYHVDHEVIERYVDSTLPKIEKEIVELHLAVCVDCSAEVTDLRDSLATMSAEAPSQIIGQVSLDQPHLPSTGLAIFRRSLRFAAIVAFAAVVLIAAVIVWRFKSNGPDQGHANGNLSAESKPTPVQSVTPPPQVVHPSLPSPGPSPNRLAENAPDRHRNGSEALIVLSDGSRTIRLEKSGNVTGLEGLPPLTRDAVRDTLKSQSIAKPVVLDELAIPDVSVRAPTGEQVVRIVYPTNRVIIEDRPSFEWQSTKTSGSYVVEVGDANFHQVAKSEELPPSIRSWSPPTPLQRGIVYAWTLRIITPADQVPPVSVSQGKFKILDDERVTELRKLKTKSPSHLALGVFYARQGMTAEAEREFQIVVKANPRSTVARNLLKTIQSWAITK